MRVWDILRHQVTWKVVSIVCLGYAVLAPGVIGDHAGMVLKATAAVAVGLAALCGDPPGPAA